MPDYKGRIFGRSVLDVRFRAFYGEDLFLGELLAGDDPERGRRYLFRVVDVTYGTEHREPGWAEDPTPVIKMLKDYVTQSGGGPDEVVSDRGGQNNLWVMDADAVVLDAPPTGRIAQFLNVHEAVSTQPAPSREDDDMVGQVYQVGYVFNGQLLRPARVVVKQWNG